jgi:uncharacterized protein YcfL
LFFWLFAAGLPNIRFPHILSGVWKIKSWKDTKIMQKITLVCMAAAVLAGCAGRSPQPVAVVQAQDAHTDCNAIMAEVQANNLQVQALAVEEGQKTTQNVAAGVAGLFVPVLWFAMDFQGTASKEAAALQARQQYLATLAGERCNKGATKR